MPEYRIDPVSHQAVIIAPERLARPNALNTLNAIHGPDGMATVDPRIDSTRETSQPPCPFCFGHEAATPAAVATFPVDSSAVDWQVRVVPNLFPATLYGERPNTAIPDDRDDLFRSEPSVGRHEVVIESREHVLGLAHLPTSQVRLVLAAYVQRLRAHEQVPGIAHSTIFKNHGRLAGASLEHTHSQILSLDRVSPAVETELKHSAQFMRDHDECLFCRLIARELCIGTRVVEESDHFLVLCPFASRLPFEFRIYPKRHCTQFDQQSSVELDELAIILRRSLLNLEKLSQHVPYNYLIHSAPFDIDASEHYHWHMEVLPRLACHAGFEWGSNIHINPVSPEQAAKQLRPTGS